MKVLNLYAGIGGNRKLWQDVDVTAVEIDPDIAKIYSEFYPDDRIIVGDAHEYLLNYYDEFDFIWSSPPCPTHSRIRKMGVQRKLYPALYPDRGLWEEITLLQHFCESIWVIENVVPYYDPIIQPMFNLDRHLFWSNFYVPEKSFPKRDYTHKAINGADKIVYGFNISKFKVRDKRRLLRNMVNPEVAKYIFDFAMGYQIKAEQGVLF
ncbi:MAG: DNA cytosine methyltransferase [Desulfobacula sp.]|jgi:DNA (cytosine-5)-methyltransferase 1|uniref:DNA cytosine methyltransferase n=1 Tax=Desulfobacula sp. TaxID=2593537 RepID=UPI0039B8EE43|nr:DNA cytosine methyltransferase [Desulfobacula sp.]